jgi:hypothetical protein
VNSPGSRQARTGQRLEAARQQQLQHHRAAVGLQLEHVFAGVGVRRREVDRQAAVDGLAVGARKGSSVAWRGGARAADGAISGFEVAPDTRTMPTAPTPGRGGDGDDGVGGAPGRGIGRAFWRAWGGERWRGRPRGAGGAAVECCWAPEPAPGLLSRAGSPA